MIERIYRPVIEDGWSAALNDVGRWHFGSSVMIDDAADFAVGLMDSVEIDDLQSSDRVEQVEIYLRNQMPPSFVMPVEVATRGIMYSKRLCRARTDLFVKLEPDDNLKVEQSQALHAFTRSGLRPTRTERGYFYFRVGDIAVGTLIDQKIKVRHTLSDVLPPRLVLGEGVVEAQHL